MPRWTVTSLALVVIASKSYYFKDEEYHEYSGAHCKYGPDASLARVLWSWAFGNACWDLQMSWLDCLFWKSDMVIPNPATFFAVLEGL